MNKIAWEGKFWKGWWAKWFVNETLVSREGIRSF